MSDSPASSASTRSRGRGKSRGGLGKYLRARGRGGRGRGAEFSQRLVLEDEETIELNEEEAKALNAKYASRGLRSNADRYEEVEPDPEAEPEPEVDLTAFLERQRLQDDNQRAVPGADLRKDRTNEPQVEAGEDEVDHDLEKLMSTVHGGTSASGSKAIDRKNNKGVLEWDESMEALKREKDAAEAMRDLKTRLQGNTKLKTPSSQIQSREPKIIEDNRAKKLDNNEAFLDDLLG